MSIQPAAMQMISAPEVARCDKGEGIVRAALERVRISGTRAGTGALQAVNSAMSALAGRRENSYSTPYRPHDD